MTRSFSILLGSLFVAVACGDEGGGGLDTDTAASDVTTAVTDTSTSADASDGAATTTDAASDGDDATETTVADDTGDGGTETTDDAGALDATPEDTTADVALDDGSDGSDAVLDVAIDTSPGNTVDIGALASIKLTWTADKPLSDLPPGVDLSIHLMVATRAVGPNITGDAAPDGWFDTTWDCHWGNTNPSWGATLDVDDVCCGGPENIAFVSSGTLSEDDVLAIGVDVSAIESPYTKGFAKVVINGTFTFEAELAAGQLWELGRIDGNLLTISDDGAGGPLVLAYSLP